MEYLSNSHRIWTWATSQSSESSQGHGRTRPAGERRHPAHGHGSCSWLMVMPSSDHGSCAHRRSIRCSEKYSIERCIPIIILRRDIEACDPLIHSQKVLIPYTSEHHSCRPSSRGLSDPGATGLGVPMACHTQNAIDAGHSCGKSSRVATSNEAKALNRSAASGKAFSSRLCLWDEAHAGNAPASRSGWSAAKAGCDE